jgi:hypothetical protein
MPTFETISTGEVALPFSTQKQLAEEKAADAGFLAMLTQMFFGSTEQRTTATADPTNQMSTGEEAHPVVPASRLEPARLGNTHADECIENATFSDGDSSFEIVSRESPAQSIRREYNSGEKPSSTPHHVDGVPLQRDASKPAVADGRRIGFQENTSRRSVAEASWDDDDASSFEIIAKLPAQLARHPEPASQAANEKISEQPVILSQTQSRNPVRTQSVRGVNTLPRPSMSDIPPGIADDIVRWDDARVQRQQKPEQLEAYMKVASELRAIADKFSVGISKATTTPGLISSGAPPLTFTDAQFDSANEPPRANLAFGSLAKVEEPLTTDAARMSQHDDASDTRQFSEGDSSLFGEMHRAADGEHNDRTTTIFRGNDKHVIATEQEKSVSAIDARTKNISVSDGDRSDHENRAEIKTHRDADNVQTPHLSNDSSQEFRNLQSLPAHDKATQPFENAKTLPARLDNAMKAGGRFAQGLVPEDFGTNLMVKAADGLRLHLEGKSQGIHVVLKPEMLGELTIRATMEEGKILAQIRVQQPEVKAALEAQVLQLSETLASQGIDVQRVEIVSDGGEMRFYNSDEGRASHQRPARFRRGQKDVDVVEELDATRSLGYNTIEYII